MANTDPVIKGSIERGPFETVGRNEAWAEQRTYALHVVGKYGDLSGVVKPGDSMDKYANWFKGRFESNMFVRTVDLSTPDGVTGEMTLTMLKCPQGKTKPFNVTWEVGMEEVQMKLINHPDIIKNANVERLLMWEDTPKSMRVKVDKDGNWTFWYYDGLWTDGAVNPKQITAPWEVAYCKAVSQGIETYNRYLPVITKNSSFLEMPGAEYSEAHIITGGTITDFTGSGVIGQYDAPDLKVAGFIDRRDGVWFKNGDRYQTNPDGTATRTESWVFTNDPSHMWIYTHQLDGAAR